MIRVTPTAVRSWADEIGITNQLFAEQDFRLVHMLTAIAENTDTAQKLYLKGGTAINKLYLQDKGLSRLSVDLDFNHIGSKEQVIQERNEIINQLLKTVRKHDSYYHLDIRKKRYEQTTIHATYTSLAISDPQHIKIEISHVERFPILPTQIRPLSLPKEGKVSLTTYSLEELISTKIRAFYDRLKGRDVYDLWSANRTGSLDKTAVRKLFLYYFYKDRKIFNPKTFFKQMHKAITENTISNDVSGYVRPDIGFNLQQASNDTVNWLGFLSNLDSSDQDFTLLARLLLGKGNIPKDRISHIGSIRYPIRSLFSDNKITEAARQITRADIAPFTKKGSNNLNL
ncbi:MAG: nucleotidyl transferase AbiEii/AbiGii toxin family protein [Thaumarchaeota archaeon]|nr:nucleotidyl transferase AbiEii/AbiGii toxin family protein [Nitrososphaerota archaeon]